MNVRILPLGPIEANCIVVWDDPSKAWIVDPGADADRLKSFLDSEGLVPALAIATHGHFDHIGAVGELLDAYEGLEFHISAGDEPMLGHPDNAWPPYYPRMEKPAKTLADLADGVVVERGGISANVVATPGHTPGGICLYFEKEALLLTGDTLFARSCGRTDFPGGSMPVLMESLSRLATLPPETRVIPGHGEETTIRQEVAFNPYLRN